MALPAKVIQRLFQSTVHRFDHQEKFTTFFTRYPFQVRTGEKLRRVPVLLVNQYDNIIVLSSENSDLENRVRVRLSTLESAMPRMEKATIALLNEVIRGNNEVEQFIEATLFQLEVSQVDYDDETFLKKTFELRTDILRVSSSLKHLRNATRKVATGKLKLSSESDQYHDAFQDISEGATELFDSIGEIREALQALVDLRLNVSSFQMNRVMRLMALLTALALIPATAGGLLGMNLLDTPWPATLPQVAFGVAAGMAISLYAFSIKGWLR